MSAERLETIAELKEAARRPIERKEFTALYAKTLEVFAIDEMELVEAKGTGHLAVSRWKTGASAPVPNVRPSVFLVLLKIIDKQLQREARAVRAAIKVATTM